MYEYVSKCLHNKFNLSGIEITPIRFFNKYIDILQAGEIHTLLMAKCVI